MAEYLIKDTTLIEIADAIRGKSGKTDIIFVKNMAEEINSLKIENKTLPVLNLSFPQDVTVAKGNNVSCEAFIDVDGVPASYTYQWYKDGIAISGAANSSYTFTPTAVGTTTIYCEVTNSAGTVTSRTATITVTNLFLYDTGNQHTDITGGWQYDSAFFSFNNYGISYSLPNYSDQSAMRTVNMINCKNYSTLKMTVNIYSVWSNDLPRINNFGISANASNQKDNSLANANTCTLGEQTLSVDISNFNESYYIYFYSQGCSGAITKIWLE